MKILFTGGGTGGHFTPIVAVAEEVNALVEKEHLIDAKLYFMAPEPYDEGALFEQNIEFVQASAGKIRRYFSLKNFFDLFRTVWGMIQGLFTVYSIFPDVIFAKGGYGSFPALFAARILGIPVVIHESDSVPGKTNAWAGKFARRIALSYPSAAEFFPSDKVALTGNPIRKDLLNVQSSGAREFLRLEEKTPVLLFLGGSLGAQIINETVLGALPKLVEKYQVIHQTGNANFEEVSQIAGAALHGNKYKDRYRPFPFLNVLAMKMSAGASDLVISRAGSTIFEIANWNLPSILIPITDSHGDHQRQNAYTYARAGACLVIEEKNLSPQVLISEIERIMTDPKELNTLRENTKKFAKPNAAELIAKELVAIALEHEEK